MIFWGKTLPYVTPDLPKRDFFTIEQAYLYLSDVWITFSRSSPLGSYDQKADFDENLEIFQNRHLTLKSIFLWEIDYSLSKEHKKLRLQLLLNKTCDSQILRKKFIKKFPKNPIFSIFREKASQFVSSRELKSDSLQFWRLNIDTKYIYQYLIPCDPVWKVVSKELILSKIRNFRKIKYSFLTSNIMIKWSYSLWRT